VDSVVVNIAPAARVGIVISIMQYKFILLGEHG